MDCSEATATFLKRCPALPEDVVDAIENGSNKRYLTQLSALALQPEMTGLIYCCFEDLFPELCQRWYQVGTEPMQLAAYARVLSVAPHLAEMATTLLSQNDFYSSISETLRAGASESVQKSGQSEVSVVGVMISIFRLLLVNREVFSKCLPVAEVPLLLNAGDHQIKNLAVRITALVARIPDQMRHSMDDMYTSKTSVDWAPHEEIGDSEIVSLSESQRIQDLRERLQNIREDKSSASQPVKFRRILVNEDFSPGVVNVCGHLMMQSSSGHGAETELSQLIMTKRTYDNVSKLANAVKTASSILVTGQAGCGKSMVIDYVADQLGKRSTMVTLHLNEQSDAKLLLGVYTAGDEPGAFKWQPGVISTAVQEGRWVLIENLDRVPSEVLGLLMPLIERGEIRIPGNDNPIKAAMGFKLLATMRSQINQHGEEHISQIRTMGMCSWQRVRFSLPNESEIKDIVREKFPQIENFLPRVMSAWTSLRQMSRARDHSPQLRQLNSSRPLSVRDLLKWCARIQKNSNLHHSKSGSVVDGLLDDMLLDAIDCFLGYLPQTDRIKIALVSCISQELHIDPKRRDFLTAMRTPECSTRSVTEAASVTFGRTVLQCQGKQRSSGMQRLREPFSLNRMTCRLMEQIAVAVRNREPVLLVGETGVGKTSVLQHMARSLGHNMVAVNLSQQSEASDLLGGYRPISIRSLVIPLNDEFAELFSRSFSGHKNSEYSKILANVIVKRQWRKAVKLWKEALKIVKSKRNRFNQTQGEHAAAQRKKRRKTSEHDESLMASRWAHFEEKLESLESRLDKPANSFAFAFVEGALVKAVRNGSWLLLDEINLASSDALDSLSDLLETGSENGRSLILTETGSTKRLQAHPDFRIFAAMNPSTDVGKKDLPLGIRSRLTEIYVDSPDKDRTSLESIIESYLCQSSTTLPRQKVCSVVADIYMQINELVQQGRLVDGSGSRARYSIRSLTRALRHAIVVAPQCSLKRGIYEGMTMCFSTSLDVPSEATLQTLLKDALFQSLKKGNVETRQPLRAPSDTHAYHSFSISVESATIDHPGYEEQHWLSKGRKDVQDSTDYIVTPFVARNLRNLVRAASTRQHPVLIQGPTSAGKTSMIEYLAHRSGNEVIRINNHEHTDLQEYLGTYVSDITGQITFQEGVLVQALRNGDWVILDELNLAPSDVLEALNRLLDDNRELFIPETQTLIKPHPNFMLFATQNPAGAYGGRKPLSRAFQNRFLELHFQDIPVAELQVILSKRSKLPASWCSLMIAVHTSLSSICQEARLFERNGYATLRDLFRWAFRGGETVQELAEHGYMLLAEKVRKPEERRLVKEAIEQTMSGKGTVIRLDGDKLYSRDQDHIVLGSTQVVWTKTMSRLFTLMRVATEHNEPVLLVGETGGGKTTVCQLLAMTEGSNLHIVNAHQNLETSDLIGAQRPIRGRDAQEADLIQTLQALFSKLKVNRDRQSSVSELLLVYDALSGEAKQMVPQDIASHIKTTRGRLTALFEWQDGSLVHAMRNGDCFLLDEISLADDSVLERMNSLLDPQRSILLAEKGSSDSLVVSKHGFQFFATMNPGGDFGKKELSPALRNRFTEIWVPPIDDLEDLVSIVKANINSQAAGYANVLVDFTIWFNSCYGASSKGSVSVRDLLSWVQFVVVSQLDVVEAIIQGALTVFIDTLGANPSGLLSLANMKVEHERAKCLEKLGDSLGVDATVFFEQNLDLRFSTDLFAIGKYSLPMSKLPRKNSDYTFDCKTTKTNAMRLLRAMQLPKPILLEGAPGVGKTSLVSALASSTGHSLTRINLSEQTDLTDLFGCDVPVEDVNIGTFTWRDAPFLTAMKNGDWVLLDEMNLASQSVLEGLNACFDHRGEVFISELGKTFSRHPSFRLFAAQNPHHEGAGRKGLPGSFVNRFTLVFADVFTQDDLQIIGVKSYPSAPKETIFRVVRFTTELNNRLNEGRGFGSCGSPWEFNVRDILRCLHLVTSKNGLVDTGELHDYLDIVFTRRFRTPADVAIVESLIASVFGPRINPKSLYTTLSPTALQIGFGLLKRADCPGGATNEVVELPAERLSLLQAMIVSLNERWPVLLVGAPEADKVGLLRSLAATAGTDLEFLSISADLDANDLIGSYEQTDPSRLLQAFSSRLKSFVHQCLSQFIRSQMAEPGQKLLTAMLGNLVHVDGIESASERAAGFSSCLATIDTVISEYLKSSKRNGLDGLKSIVPAMQQECAELALISMKPAPGAFEWVDGTIVKALQSGTWLVLENANLCSSSVLDRLNSLLEVDGSLIINEHSSDDGTVKTIKPHPAFRIFLTMDPQFGEISRAMRNRVTELYVPVPFDRPESILMPLDASEFGIAQLVKYCQNRKEDEIVAQALVYAVQRLNSNDLKVLRGYLLRAPQCLTSKQTRHLASILDKYDRIPLNQPVEHQSHALEKERLHSIHPLSNPHVSVFTSTFDYDYRLTQMYAGLYHDCLYQNTEVEEHLNHLQSILSKAGRLPSKMSSNPLDDAELLKIAKGHIMQLVLEMDPSLSSRHPVQQLCVVLDLIQILRIVVQAYEVSSIQQDALPAYIDALRRAVDKFSDDVPNSSTLCKILSNALSKLSLARPFKTGQSMDRIWCSYRPQTPGSSAGLDALLAFEKLADVFDSNVATATVPLADLRQGQEDFSTAMLLARTDSVDAAQLLKRMQDLSPSKLSGSLEVHTHFQQVFRAMHSFKSFITVVWPASIPAETIIDQEIKLLARLPTKYLVNPTEPDLLQRRLSAFHDYYLANMDDSNVFLDFRTMLSKAFRSINAVADVPLQRFTLLQDEVRVVGKYFASRAPVQYGLQQQALYQHIRSIVQTIVSAHHDYFADSRTLEKGNLQLSDDLPRDHYFRLIVDQHLSKTYGSTGDETETPQSWYDLGRQLVHLAIGCLYLYIPDRVHDPAQQSLIGKWVHQQRLQDLEYQIEGLCRVESFMTGQTRNLRTELLTNRKDALGPVPDLQVVLRPAVSRLSELQSEMNAMLRVVDQIERAIHESRLEDLAGSGILQNVSKSIRALSDEYRSYDDITTTAVRFLECLSLGIQIVSRYAPRQHTMQHISVSAQRQIPFIDADLTRWSRGCPDLRDHIRSNDLPELESTMRILGARAQIEKPSDWPASTRETLSEALRTLFEDWKKNLKGQSEHEAKASSLYHYRGDEQAQDETDEVDFLTLFSTDALDDRLPHQDPPPPDSYNANAIASMVGQLHQQIFLGDSEAVLPMVELIRHASVMLSRQNAGSEEILQTYSGALLMPLLLTLQQRRNEICFPIHPARSYNIYSDPNIPEALRLKKLVTGLQDRTRSIIKVWPEHATLHNIVEASQQLLLSRHSQSIATFFVKVEQLHGYIAEWQTVASRDYSLADHYDDLTRLIVSWRQIELSTWARLLEIETENAKMEARSWWFVAFENIIVMPASFDASVTEMQSYVIEIVATVESLLRGSSIGQYDTKLKIIASLTAQLEVFHRRHEVLCILAQALGGLVAHYRRFVHPITLEIIEGRAQLEKEVKNVIQMASWKDTNILALRQSAKASHRKLFTVVRKFRKLLQTQAEPFLTSQPSVDSTRSFSQPLHSNPCHVDGVAIQICESRTDSWSARPLRLRNVTATTTTMRDMCKILEGSDFNACTQMQDFHSTTKESVEVLMRGTPSLLTKENSASVKHLSQQKRSLLAGTLKDVRSMGIRPAQKVEVLLAQSSHARVLVNNSLWDKSSSGSLVVSAVEHLRAAIENMDQIRSPSRKHHADLTSSDVVRAVGMIEGLLALSLEQRNAVMEYEARQESLSTVLGKFKSLWQHGKCQATPISHEDLQSRQALKMIITWLPEMIKTAIYLLRVQSECGECNFSSVLESLAEHCSNFERLREILSEDPMMVEGLSSIRMFPVEQEGRAAVESLERDIAKWSQGLPVTGLIVNQLLRWTRFGDNAFATDQATITSSITLEVFNSDVYAALDCILGAIQDVRQAMLAYPSGPQDKDWLIKSNNTESAVLSAFRVPLVSSLLESLLARMKDIDDGVPNSLESACASLTLALPIIEQYAQLHQKCLSRFVQLHCATASTLSSFSKIFITIATQGFCKPSEKSEDEAQGKEKLESGTGLGDGEGADDISKDIEADEDLSELAQDRDNAGSNDDEGSNAGDKDDAVDIEDELQGGRGGSGKEKTSDDDDDDDDGESQEGERGSDRDIGDAGEGDDDMEGEGEGEENSGVDEAEGHVDDRYPSAADEKMWDEAPEKDAKQKEGKQNASTKDDEQQAAGIDRDGSDQEGQDRESDGEELPADSGDEEKLDDSDNDRIPKENEPMDPHVHQSEGLELPEELNLNGDKERNDLDDSDIDMISDEEDADMAGSDGDAENAETRSIEDTAATDTDLDTLEQPDECVINENQGTDDTIDKDGQQEDASMPDKTQDSSLKPYADQQRDDNDADPTGTAQGKEGTDTVAGWGEADQAQLDIEENEAAAPTEARDSDNAEAIDESNPSTRGRAGRSNAAQDPVSESQSEEQKWIKQVGDVMRQYYHQHRQIKEHTSTQDQGESNQNELELGDADFEHLPDENAEADAQALGAAAQDQARPVDESLALPTQQENDLSEKERETFMPDADELDVQAQEEDVEMDDSAPVEPSNVNKDNTKPSATIGRPMANDMVEESREAENIDTDIEMQDEPPASEVSDEMQTMHLQPNFSTSSSADIWAQHEASTQNLSQLLTEQLRLILAPTLATKLRGGHRTGKRLNLKAIIPYIASSYKRDKIWLRRSHPSKRTYQIQLALDDSKSMAENGSSNLAFATLALVARALTMLESGEVGVLGFGKDVFVAHQLGMPFTSESGAAVVGSFGFEQTITDVKALVRSSIDSFKDARMRSQSASDLWQLQLIISDGICEDHPGIRRLLLEAQEERIMFIFVVVDATDNNKSTPQQQSTNNRIGDTSSEANSKGKGKAVTTPPDKKQSITDLLVAEFTEGPKGPDGEAGETKLVRRRYMETFPFPYYLIVEDVRDLPDVLSAALRQWFAEVADV